MSLQYANDSCTTFVREAEEAGYAVTHYRGRNFWEGPCVRLRRDESYEDFVRCTSLALQRDHLGLGLVVYPLRGGKLKEGQ